MAAATEANLAEVIELLVQILEEILHFARGELRICHVATTAKLLFQRIQRLHKSIRARENASVVASRAVGLIKAVAVLSLIHI